MTFGRHKVSCILNPVFIEKTREQKTMPLPIVAIVGRPNVGKSSLFNCITKKRIAVVHDQPGVTRDRIYADVEWEGSHFTVVDTGGLDLAPEDDLIDMVQLQVEVALEEARVILFVVDVRTGILPQDLVVADRLRQTNKPIFVVVNKVDSERFITDIPEFYEMGLSEPFPISCTQNIGVAELLDAVVFAMPESEEEAPELPQYIKIAIVGRPNVGKSSLINTILGEERMVVDDRPGTTRDAVNIRFIYNHVPFELIDTAGMRRKSAIDTELESVTVQRAIRSIRRSDISWLILDAMREVSRQDKAIADFIARQGKACLIAVNKWDAIEKDNYTHNQFVQYIRDELPQLTYVPLIFISALTNQRVTNLFDLSLTIHREYSTEVPTHELNNLFVQLRNAHQPPRVGNIRPSLKYITQIKTQPPTFLIFARYANKIPPSYQSYLINGIREAFGFHGTPIRIHYRATDKKRRG
jgi:GTPase